VTARRQPYPGVATGITDSLGVSLALTAEIGSRLVERERTELEVSAWNPGFAIGPTPRSVAKS
jgi:hypothetical protein